MTANGEPLNSRTITVWLPERDRDYLLLIAEDLELFNRDGTANRNGALRAIIEDHRKLRIRRLANKR